MVKINDVWNISKNVAKYTNPLTYVMMKTTEEVITKATETAKSGNLDEMKTALAQLEISARMQELQAKIAQELAIARRIDIAEEVTIEEFYDNSGEGSLGVNANGEGIVIGASGAGRKVSKRVYTFKGFREDLNSAEEGIEQVITE